MSRGTDATHDIRCHWQSDFRSLTERKEPRKCSFRALGGMCRAFAKTRESYNFISNFFRLRTVKTEAKKLNAILAEMIKKRFDSVVQEKTDLSGKKGLSIMDLVLRDFVEESRQVGREVLDPAFLKNAMTQIKTLLAAGSGTTSNTICYSMMM